MSATFRVFYYDIDGYQIERSFATGSAAGDDYLVVNDNLDRAHQQLNAIVAAARCSRAWCAHLAEQLLTEGSPVGAGGTVTPLVAAPHD